MTPSYKIFPIGFVRKSGRSATIEIQPEFMPALLGLDQFSHIYVLYWFHENDTASKRRILQVHPRNDKRNPLTGVFATHSPVRPNLIALTPCRILSIRANIIDIDEIDASDGSPVVDIKSYNAGYAAVAPIRVPEWARHGKRGCRRT